MKWNEIICNVYMCVFVCVYVYCGLLFDSVLHFFSNKQKRKLKGTGTTGTEQNILVPLLFQVRNWFWKYICICIITIMIHRKTLGCRLEKRVNSLWFILFDPLSLLSSLSSILSSFRFYPLTPISCLFLLYSRLSYLVYPISSILSLPSSRLSPLSSSLHLSSIPSSISSIRASKMTL